MTYRYFVNEVQVNKFTEEQKQYYTDKFFGDRWEVKNDHRTEKKTIEKL